MICKSKKFRSFHIGSKGSAGQRATKLLAVKVGGLTKKSAGSAITADVYASMIGLGSTTPQTKSFSKFERWKLCSPLTYRPYITCMERS